MAELINIIVDQGSDFQMETTITDINGTPFDLTTFTVTGAIATDYGSAAVANFDIEKVSAASGEIRIKLTAAETDSLPESNFLNGPPTAVYDIKMTDGSVTKRIMHGKVIVNPKVT